MKFSLFVLAVLSGFAGAGNAQPVSIDAFIEMARDADIVALGEIHDNPDHHRNQAGIVAALQPGALVFEMIPQDREAEVNNLRKEGAGREEIAAALDWENSGWPEFSYYAGILEAAPEARIFGAGQPKEDVRRAMTEGAAAVFGADASNYGLDQPLDPAEQDLREAMQAEAHCNALPRDMLPGMVEAQRFRDAGLADAALWARSTTAAQVVVITGDGHADKLRGMPAAVMVADPDARIITLGQFEEEPEDAEAWDAWMVSPPAERDDPCERLTGGGG
jgi:uncharacterized iron-regulated protein